MHIRTFVGVLAFAAAATVAAPSGAFAADTADSVWDDVWTGSGMSVSVKEYGDIISVCDTTTNGHTASAWVYAGPDLQYRLEATGDIVGSCATARASSGGSFDLPEDEGITVIYNGDGGGIQTAFFVNDQR
ncbi:hypothetical protein PV664_35315 [Streptomyces sp. ME01-18a]|uniref:hypothetical protein n=1 Tax=Streptomyces sp. ME01-18a TaxID=3028669 RepID=UPI0029BE9030|nr:hypothetical protein [Streptomyces sp. ME01-18a]MDX3434144.1 hypothetical protein [Streptomyces sp. ME01-18a]